MCVNHDNYFEFAGCGVFALGEKVQLFIGLLEGAVSREHTSVAVSNISRRLKDVVGHGDLHRVVGLVQANSVPRRYPVPPGDPEHRADESPRMSRRLTAPEVDSAAEALRWEQDAWRPMRGVRSVGQVFMPVAACAPASSRTVFMRMSNHVHEHLGQQIAYARMNRVIGAREQERSWCVPRLQCATGFRPGHPAGTALLLGGRATMQADRRDFMKHFGAAAAGAGAGSVTRVAPSAVSAGQPEGRLHGIEAFAFDAYGTLFDVFSVTALCEDLFPGDGAALAQVWRAKQLQYSLLRSLMGRHRDFWLVTQDALVYASKRLGLDLSLARRDRLMEAYLTLAAFPDVRPGLEALKTQGVKLAILSNGEPRMLEAAARGAGIDTLLDAIISVEDVKIFKVSPRVYQLGLERLQVGRTALGFVSSNSWDINGAASAGLTTFWIQRTAGEPAEELGFAADRVVAAITDLAPLLGRDVAPCSGPVQQYR